MITKKKTKYDVETITGCLTDNATNEAGAVAFQTFKTEEVEISNDYHIPFPAICAVKVKISTEEYEIEDETCVTDEPVPPIPGQPQIIGADNTTINQGIGIDLREGVSAIDGNGNPIAFTVEPSEIDACDVGVHEVIYTATDSQGQTVTVIRKITINQITAPTISGNTDMVVAPNEEFDPLEGVTATDGNGNPVEVEVKEN